MDIMKTILVIDDNTSIVRTVKKILEKEGYEVDTAFDGNEGIRKIDNGSYELLISDMIMPEQHGQELARYLADKSGETPLLIMTGGGTLLTKEMATEIAKKVTPYILLKPFDGQALKAKMDEIFNS